jgi:hypothetical protein
MEATTIRCRCSGSMHEIALIRGSLVLLDHDVVKERAMVALGAEPCRCLEILRAWRDASFVRLPAELAKLRGLARDRGASRATRRLAQDPLSVPLLKRLAPKVAAEAKAALERCRYRRSQSRWAGGAHTITVIVAAGSEPSIRGDSQRRWSDNGKWSGYDSEIHVKLPLQWLHVRRLCGGVVDGVFVLAIVEQVGDGAYRVLAGRQGRGFEVYAAPAVIRRSESDTWSLKWEGK